MKKILLIAVAALGSIAYSTSAQAQERLKLEVGYNAAMPMGSFKNDFISNTSFRGAFGEVSYAISPKFSLGLNIGYQSYYEKFDRRLYSTHDGQTISAVRTNAMETMPFLLKGTFYPIADRFEAKVQPYFSAAAGLNMVTYQQFHGEFGGSDISTPIAAQAGAGVLIPFSRASQTALKLGATYNYSAYKEYELDGLSNVGVQASVIFPLR